VRYNIYSANAMANVDAVYCRNPVVDADDMAIYMGRDYFQNLYKLL
jgi:hypothetical protein